MFSCFWVATHIFLLLFNLLIYFANYKADTIVKEDTIYKYQKAVNPSDDL
jgi:hypothetical protein